MKCHNERKVVVKKKRAQAIQIKKGIWVFHCGLIGKNNPKELRSFEEK